MFKKILVVSVALLFFALSEAYATTVLYTDFDELVEKSDQIVMGTVKKVKSKRYQKNGNLYTIIKLKDASIIDENGETPTNEIVKIRFEGGKEDIIENGQKVGEEGMHIEGTPELKKGERVVLFIRDNGVASVPIMGLGQGVFRITDGDTVADHVNTPVVGLDGSHILLKTDDGLKNRKELLRSPSASSQVIQESTDMPELVSSDGGEDRLIPFDDIEGGEQRALEPSHHSENISGMDKNEFISMIQETKKSKMRFRTQSNNSTKDSRKSLFNLPRPVKENRAAGAQEDENDSSTKGNQR